MSFYKQITEFQYIWRWIYIWGWAYNLMYFLFIGRQVYNWGAYKCVGVGGGGVYSICIFQSFYQFQMSGTFVSWISQFWSLKGSFFHEFANEQHFWDYGTFQRDYSTFRRNCLPTPPLSSSEKKVLKGHNIVVFQYTKVLPTLKDLPKY